MSIHKLNKELMQDYFDSLYHFENIEKSIDDYFSDQALIQWTHPFNTLSSKSALFGDVYMPLLKAIPNIERRDYIRVAGGDAKLGNWVGTAGYYMGDFIHLWLDIPANKRLVGFRYCEFYKIENNKIVETQVLWDIPELMMQANAWPMSPSLGVHPWIPGPATQDGIVIVEVDPDKSQNSLMLVKNMLKGLLRYAEGGVEAMELDSYWHEKFNWYGPAAIGSSRGIKGFRQCHQIPFLNALPDRDTFLSNIAFFGDDNYVAYTAWPGMTATVSGDGWLGIAPSGQKITLRSLDFWRCENGKLRENWVIVDLLDIYHQLGVNVFSRMKEYCKLN